MGNAIELRDVYKVYGKEIKTEVIHGVSLEIKQGSFVAIVGQSGSGKSTLLNIMSTLDNSSSGEVYINEVLINELTKNKIAKLRSNEIGFVFQFHYLLPEFNVLENVLMPNFILNNNKKYVEKERAMELLKEVGLGDKVKYKVNMLSGGEQQRVAIARALMNNASIIFADEPTGNLDSDGTKNIYDLLRKINLKYNTTFIIITHDRSVAQSADRIIEINDGVIEFDIDNTVK